MELHRPSFYISELCIRPNLTQSWGGPSVWLAVPVWNHRWGLSRGWKDSLCCARLSAPGSCPQGRDRDAPDVKPSHDPSAGSPYQEGFKFSQHKIPSLEKFSFYPLPRGTTEKVNTNPGWETLENQNWILPGKKYDLPSLKWHFDSCLMIPVILTESFLLTWTLGTSWIWSHQSLTLY